jgi:hypothetical protein
MAVLCLGATRRTVICMSKILRRLKRHRRATARRDAGVASLAIAF